ncbi:MAG: hypothetical protein SWK76_07255 [Actinomycetota bacterium]|nr:hypothetical protein [Actinomycetota bacterium]
MRCYFCDYKQADQDPLSGCPDDCTIVQLLRASELFYAYLRPSVGLGIAKAFEEKTPQMKDLFENIDRE